jgi:hypothetical protein
LSVIATEDVAAARPHPGEDGWHGSYEIRTSDGTGESNMDVLWTVNVRPHKPGLITRQVLRDGTEWKPVDGKWAPEPTVWPAWSPALAAQGCAVVTPLTGVREYWAGVSDRLRDSAKWTAAVLGAALAVVAGTSPLTEMAKHPLNGGTAVQGSLGLALLAVTLFLVLQVMRPRSVSYADVQLSDRRWWHATSPLRRWKRVVESQQDLYLPCGVKCLESLRQAMIVEEVTLAALACAVQSATEKGLDVTELKEAQHVRAARLKELRNAAAQVAVIGEYYRLKRRSSWATYGGVLCGVAGAAIVIATLAWPH